MFTTSSPSSSVTGTGSSSQTSSASSSMTQTGSASVSEYCSSSILSKVIDELTMTPSPSINGSTSTNIDVKFTQHIGIIVFGCITSILVLITSCIIGKQGIIRSRSWFKKNVFSKN